MVYSYTDQRKKISNRLRRTTVEDARAQGGVALLQVLAPGLITGASDVDPSGIGTYSQVGSQFGWQLRGWHSSPSL
jgi:hypothetical protein